jgi:hypothetical protein
MNTAEFETNLRETLAHRAAGVPAAAGDRLRRRTYRPRTHGRAALATAVTGGAAAVAAGAALAVTALAPASQPASHQSYSTQAWTVSKDSNGDIVVLYWSPRDPAGLEAKLRAYGVPSSVTVGHINPACHHYTGPVLKHGQMGGAVSKPGSGRPSRLVIDPSDIPPGAGLEIAVNIPHHGGFGSLVGLVQATQACTGTGS